jgi:hypothetical protein
LYNFHMIDEPKKKLEVPSECSTEEFTRFENLAKLLVSVPKKAVKNKEKGVKKVVRKSKS